LAAVAIRSDSKARSAQACFRAAIDGAYCNYRTGSISGRITSEPGIAAGTEATSNDDNRPSTDETIDTQLVDALPEESRSDAANDNALAKPSKAITVRHAYVTAPSSVQE
jgi:hypothetical protein